MEPNGVQITPNRVPELEGELEIPSAPEISAGYANIYRGVWRNLEGKKVEVAIKELKTLIPKTRQSSREALEIRTNTRMRREVWVWSQVKHPNIHPFLGYRLHPQPQLISPWCKHGNLTDYLGENPHLSRLDKLRLIHQIARGLDYLHSQNPPICHADIKPENALINDRLEVALSDFGLSRVLQDLDGHSGLTTSEGPKGTHNYMARELFADEKPRPSCESDVYAFGGLILTVMSGKPPFWGNTSVRLFSRVMQNQLPKPEEHPSLPSNDRLWSLMRRCWDPNPASRPSMREIMSKVQDEISCGMGSPSSFSPPSSIYENPPQPIRSPPSYSSFEASLLPKGLVSDSELLESQEIQYSTRTTANASPYTDSPWSVPGLGERSPYLDWSETSLGFNSQSRKSNTMIHQDLAGIGLPKQGLVNVFEPGMSGRISDDQTIPTGRPRSNAISLAPYEVFKIQRELQTLPLPQYGKLLLRDDIGEVHYVGQPLDHYGHFRPTSEQHEALLVKVDWIQGKLYLQNYVSWQGRTLGITWDISSRAYLAYFDLNGKSLTGDWNGPSSDTIWTVYSDNSVHPIWIDRNGVNHELQVFVKIATLGTLGTLRTWKDGLISLVANAEGFVKNRPFDLYKRFYLVFEPQA